jgi:hypothetical protein
LLEDDLQESKKTFRKVLLDNPTAHIKAYTLCNLATACWWEKYPNYHNYDPLEFDEDEENEDDEEIYNRELNYMRDKDFEQVIPLYKNSLFFMENLRGKLTTEKGTDMLKFLKVKNINDDSFDAFVTFFL